MLFKKVVLLSSYDAADVTAWSGVPYHFLRALRKVAREVILGSPLHPHRSSEIVEKVRRYERLRKDYFPDRDLEVLERRAVETNRLLKNNRDADCILVLHPPEAAYLDTEVPVLIVHDALWSQFVNSYPMLARFIARENYDHGAIAEGKAFHNATWVVFFSEWAAHAARQAYPSLVSRIRVNPPGANLDAIPSRLEVLDIISERQTGECKLLFVGGELYRKGLDIALEVLIRLVEMGLSVSMDVVGVPRTVPHRPCSLGFEMHPSIREKVRAYGRLSKAIPQESTLLAKLYADASFILIPSRADCGSLALCDAAAFGLPAVSSGVGGIGELVSTGQNGFIVGQDADSVNYATCIQQAIQSQSGFRLLCEGARVLYEETLNWDAHIQRLANLVRGQI